MVHNQYKMVKFNYTKQIQTIMAKNIFYLKIKENSLFSGDFEHGLHPYLGYLIFNITINESSLDSKQCPNGSMGHYLSHEDGFDEWGNEVVSGGAPWDDYSALGFGIIPFEEGDAYNSGICIGIYYELNTYFENPLRLIKKINLKPNEFSEAAFLNPYYNSLDEEEREVAALQEYIRIFKEHLDAEVFEELKDITY
jgi:hypothetical protein